MSPEQIKQEQERVLKPLEKYETLLAEYEREDEAYWLQDNVLSKPYPRRLEAKRRRLERLREELNDSLTPTLARQYAALLDAHLALHAQLAQAEGREKALREAIGVYITHVYACLGIDDDKMVSTFAEALNGGPQ